MSETGFSEEDLNKYIERRGNDLETKVLKEYPIKEDILKRSRIVVSGNTGNQRFRLVSHLCRMLSGNDNTTTDDIYVFSDTYEEAQKFKNITRESYCLNKQDSVEAIEGICHVSSPRQVIVINFRRVQDSKVILDMFRLRNNKVNLIIVCGNLTPIPKEIKMCSDLFFLLKPNSMRTLQRVFRDCFSSMCPEWVTNEYFFNSTFKKYMSDGSCMVFMNNYQDSENNIMFYRL